jgi:hypothetical protein
VGATKPAGSLRRCKVLHKATKAAALLLLRLLLLLWLLWLAAHAATLLLLEAHAAAGCPSTKAAAAAVLILPHQATSRHLALHHPALHRTHAALLLLRLLPLLLASIH